MVSGRRTEQVDERQKAGKNVSVGSEHFTGCAAAGTGASVELSHSIQETVIFLMTSDPKPGDPVLMPEGDSTIGTPDFDGPYSPFLLESERRMKGIAHEELVLFNGQILHFGGQT